MTRSPRPAGQPDVRQGPRRAAARPGGRPAAPQRRRRRRRRRPGRRRGLRPAARPGGRRCRRRWSRSAATAWSTSRCRWSPAPTYRSASSRPAPATTSPGRSGSRWTTRWPPSTWPSPAGPDRSTSGRASGRWFAGVLGSGFDSMVNERANRMTLAERARRYNLAILAELRTFRPVPYALELDGETLADRGDAGRGRQRAVVRRRHAGLPGRPARRRAARRHRARADLQARVPPGLPDRLQGHPRRPPRGHRAPRPPGHAHARRG